MLTKNHRQEAFSRAYVQATAAIAGVSTSTPDYDYGIDMCLREIVQVQGQFIDSGAQLDLQIKSTTIANVDETEIRYDLAVRAYQILRATAVRCPRYLVVLVLPENEEEWLEQGETGLTMKYAAYWLSLRGRPESTARSSIRVRIPRVNLFSVIGLGLLLDDYRGDQQ